MQDSASRGEEKPAGPLVIASSRFADHVNPPGHPERTERAETMDVVAAWWRGRGGEVVEPRPAAREELLRAHVGTYLDAIAATAGMAVALDPDTYTSPQSHETALAAAGAAIMAVDAAIGGRAALAMVRPPGHHAGRDRAMGFCLYNNAAVAAAHARARGLDRVAIVDIDVHHGNGTQAIFYEDPSVLYVSFHQFPFYPGTGEADEIGAGAGRGFTVNVPLEAGADDTDYDLVCGRVCDAVLAPYRPDLILVSVGFDAHDRDPLGGMRMSTGGYARVLERLRTAAEAHAGGRIAAVTEGGYDLVALREGLESGLGVLGGAAVSGARGGGAGRRGESGLRETRAALGRYWPAL